MPLIPDAMIKTTLLLISIVLLAGCATVAHGPMQTVTITSKPSGAAVFIGKRRHGVTPCEVRLPRPAISKILLEKPGYLPKEIVLKPHIPGEFNALGLVFLIIPINLASAAVDVATLSVFVLKPVPAEGVAFTAEDDEYNLEGDVKIHCTLARQTATPKKSDPAHP